MRGCRSTPAAFGGGWTPQQEKDGMFWFPPELRSLCGAVFQLTPLPLVWPPYKWQTALKAGSDGQKHGVVTCTQVWECLTVDKPETPELESCNRYFNPFGLQCKLSGQIVLDREGSDPSIKFGRLRELILGRKCQIPAMSSGHTIQHHHSSYLAFLKRGPQGGEFTPQKCEFFFITCLFINSCLRN